MEKSQVGTNGTQGETREPYKISENVKGIDHLVDLGVDV